MAPHASRPHPRPRRRTLPSSLLVVVLALLAVAGAACGGSDESGSGSAADVALTEEDRGAAADTAADTAGGSVAERAPEDGVGGSAGRSALAAAPPGPDGADRAVISTGNVALASDDVEQTAFDVQQVVDAHAGETTEQRTATDEGEVARVRMVLRIPSEEFTAAFDELEQLADLTASSATAEDVTTEVIDTQVRIRAQRRSLRRVEVLLDRASSISDIVRIEAQLTERQAALDSLEQRAAYLADQTSMSTIRVTVERVAGDPEPEEDDGFLAGLAGGWGAMVAFVTGLATAAGWTLPFLLLLAVVGVPVWLLWRGRRRRTAAGPVVDGGGAAG